MSTNIRTNKKESHRQQEESISKELDEVIRYYEIDKTSTDVVFFCKDFLAKIVNGGKKENGLEGEINRILKVLTSYYETGNPYLAYQQCLNIRRKYFDRVSPIQKIF